MPGPIPIFRNGEPAFPALNAEVLNAMAEGIRMPPRPARGQTSDISRVSTVECLVLNNTSASYDVHSIMAINSTASAGLTVTTDQEKLNFQRRPLFTVNVPATSSDFPFVLLEPLKASGGIARAAIGGIAVCTVNITNASHDYANPTPADHTKMTSSDSSGCRIIHKPSGIGNKTCAVMLDQSSTGGILFGGYAAGTFSGIPPYTYPDLTIANGYVYNGTVTVNASLYSPGSTLSTGNASLLLRNFNTGASIVYQPSGATGYQFYWSNGVQFSNISAGVMPVSLTGTMQIYNNTGADYKVYCDIDGINCLGSIFSTHWTYSLQAA